MTDNLRYLNDVKTDKLCAVHLTGAVLEEYSRTRSKDAEAICDLSMYNYLEVFLKSYSVWSTIIFCHEIEMRNHVALFIHNMTGGVTYFNLWVAVCCWDSDV